jgi:hypothetical protein
MAPAAWSASRERWRQPDRHNAGWLTGGDRQRDRWAKKSAALLSEGPNADEALARQAVHPVWQPQRPSSPELRPKVSSTSQQRKWPQRDHDLGREGDVTNHTLHALAALVEAAHENAIKDTAHLRHV